MNELITIGELARRSGVAASALRFYEDRGLIASVRDTGVKYQGKRRYRRDVLRRVAFIRVAQNVGLSLDEVAQALAALPDARTPGRRDWEKLSRSWQPLLQQRIDTLVAMRDQLSSCIGCGCLSLQKCRLYNPGDVAGNHGDGPRYLLGDRSSEVLADAEPDSDADLT